MTLEELKSKIAALGDSMESALSVLRDLKIKGVPGDCDNCILSRYLFGPQEENAKTYVACNYTKNEAVVYLSRSVRLELPVHLGRLASYFDHNHYLDLEEEPG